MSQTTSSGGVPPIVNRVMTLALRSPLHGIVSKNILLITFTGRKSGRAFTTPVSYSQHGNQVTIFSHANWWKNLKNGSPVTLRIRGRDWQGLAEPIVDDKHAIAAALAEHLRQVPADAKWYGVTFDEHRDPREDEVVKSAQNAVMVRIRLC